MMIDDGDDDGDGYDDSYDDGERDECKRLQGSKFERV